ncbi:hypothetical protein ABZ299_12530 [Streptomyces sp. NPDC006184]|uniref:hypothetical protein n=1 Tax=Streptomyces sp. NPDC006184 TaxID=3155455 RepID=UPI0033B49624
MSIRDRARNALYDALNTSDGSPAGARRATQTASLLAHAASQQGHSTTAVIVSALGAAAVAAEGALTNYVHPPGEYAGFREEAQR